jgi:hypothetical protein
VVPIVVDVARALDVLSEADAALAARAADAALHGLRIGLVVNGIESGDEIEAAGLGTPLGQDPLPPRPAALRQIAPGHPRPAQPQHGVHPRPMVPGPAARSSAVAAAATAYKASPSRIGEPASAHASRQCTKLTGF